MCSSRMNVCMKKAVDRCAENQETLQGCDKDLWGKADKTHLLIH